MHWHGVITAFRFSYREMDEGIGFDVDIVCMNSDELGAYFNIVSCIMKPKHRYLAQSLSCSLNVRSGFSA